MTVQDRQVGVIGGMGPMATVDFMAEVIAATPAVADQDHVHMLVDNNPHVPSRQAAMRGEGDDPGAAIAAAASRLEQMGADFLVMPCNLAHAWQGDIEAATSIPFISIVDVSVSRALDLCGDDSPIGLMTTPGCFAAGLYQRAISARGRSVITQTPDELEEAMQLVYRIKQGDTTADVAAGLQSLGQRLIDRGARVLIAACTEFPLLIDASMFDVAFVSSTHALADKTVALALNKQPFPGE